MMKILGIIFLVFYIYTIISTISVLLLENRNPEKSFSWVLVLVFLPVLGLFFYILLGQNYRKRKMISRKSIRRITQRPVSSIDINQLDTSYMDKHFIRLIKLLYKNSEASGYAYNKINIYFEYYLRYQIRQRATMFFPTVY